MAKRPYRMTEAKIDKFKKQGRGGGGRDSYKPWLTVMDVPSTGLCVRTAGLKAGRIHHLLSEHERNVFLDCDSHAQVLDIREQFPLERAETVAIAEAMGIRHPSDRGVDIVMTTDALVDIDMRGQCTQVAFSAKYAAELEEERVVEKLEIERRYWEVRDIRYFVLTEHEVSKVRSDNLMFFREYLSFENLVEPTAGHWVRLCDAVLEAVGRAGMNSLADVMSEVERIGRFSTGDGLAGFRHLVANGRLGIDLDLTFDPRMPVSAVRVPELKHRTAA